MTDLTGRSQIAALHTSAKLVEMALGFGADRTPSWSISPDGVPFGTLLFGGAPTGAEMDPWRLAAGAHTVRYHTYDDANGLTATSVMSFEFEGLRFNLMAMYPDRFEVPAPVVQTLGSAL